MVTTRHVLRVELDALRIIRATITENDDIGIGIGQAYGAMDDGADQLAALMYRMSSLAGRAYLTATGYDVRQTLADIDRQIKELERKLATEAQAS